jgi:hypothetical protein
MLFFDGSAFNRANQKSTKSAGTTAHHRPLLTVQTASDKTNVMQIETINNSAAVSVSSSVATSAGGRG